LPFTENDALQQTIYARFDSGGIASSRRTQGGDDDIDIATLYWGSDHRNGSPAVHAAPTFRCLLPPFSPSPEVHRNGGDSDYAEDDPDFFTFHVWHF
jgi:hypothetical protein